MKADRGYPSSIPADARERVISRYSDGDKYECAYRLNRKTVGVRYFDDTGEVEVEYALKDGKKHGFERHFWNGVLAFVEPFVDGVAHGVAKQWDEKGLLGTYRLNRATGLDLWRLRRDDGSICLAEAAVLKEGYFTYQCFIDDNQTNVYIERRMSGPSGHEIIRHWNAAGRLLRGYPKYSVSGKPVTRRQYLKAAKSDPTVPAFRIEDNRPERAFPPEIAKHLRPPLTKRR